MGRSWKCLEVQSRKSLHIAMNRILKAILVRTQRKEENYRESVILLRKYLSNTEQYVGRYMDGNNHSDEVSDINEEHVIRNGGRPALL